MDDRIAPSEISRKLTALVNAAADSNTGFEVSRQTTGAWFVQYRRDGRIYSGEISGDLAAAITIDPKAGIGAVQGRLKSNPVGPDDVETAATAPGGSGAIRAILRDMKINIGLVETYLDALEAEDE